MNKNVFLFSSFFLIFSMSVYADTEREIEELKAHQKKIKNFELKGEVVEAETKFLKKIISCQNIGGCGGSVDRGKKDSSTRQVIDTNVTTYPTILSLLDNKVLFKNSSFYLSVGDNFGDWKIEKVNPNGVILRSVTNNTIKLINYQW